MTFDPVPFGYGLGLVMCGWIAGQLVGAAIRTIRGIRP